MTKAQFLTSLRQKLSGEVTETEVENTIRYYDEYISDEMRRGKTEQQLMQELGNPLLIARTIIDTAGKERKSFRGEQKVYETEGESKPRSSFLKKYHLEGIALKAAIILVAVVILFLVFTILKVLIPILLPVILIWMIISIIRSGGRR